MTYTIQDLLFGLTLLGACNTYGPLHARHVLYCLTLAPSLLFFLSFTLLRAEMSHMHHCFLNISEQEELAWVQHFL